MCVNLHTCVFSLYQQAPLPPLLLMLLLPVLGMQVYILPHMCVFYHTCVSSVHTCVTPSTGHLLPQQVVSNPKLVSRFVNHWSNKLPDLTDLPVIEPKRLQYWIRNKLKGVRERRLPHKDLPGLCAQMYNSAIDFAMANNFWPGRLGLGLENKLGLIKNELLINS